MTIRKKRFGKYWCMGLPLAMGLLMPVSAAFAENAPTIGVPLYSDGVQRAVVEADSYAFTPNHLIVKVGKPVELIFKSVTWMVPHNVIIDDPRSGLNVREEIPAGESLTVTFTPMVPGSFAIYCDKKLPFFKSHREKGQEGVLEVR